MIDDIRPMGDRALLLTVEHPADVAARICDLNIAGLIEAIPAAATVLVRFDTSCDRTSLRQTLSELDDVASLHQSSTHIVIPVTYDGEDLADVAALCGLSAEEVIRIHSDALYTVAFCGFAPGFAYLRGLDPRLITSRLSSPRPRVPAGAVAIADTWSAVYPRESPGGWRLLGTTAATLFDLSRPQPAMLQPGDTVQFTPTNMAR